MRERLCPGHGRSRTPAELAASRIDFAVWLRSFSRRDRNAARLLAEGGRTADVADDVGVSPARIGQLRGELRRKWELFHEPAADDVEAASAA